MHKIFLITSALFLLSCGQIKKVNPTPEDADQQPGEMAKFGENFSLKGELEPLAENESFDGDSYSHSLTKYYVLQVLTEGEVNLEQNFIAAKSCPSGTPKIAYSIVKESQYVMSKDNQTHASPTGFDGFELPKGLYKAVVTAYGKDDGCSILDGTLKFTFESLP